MVGAPDGEVATSSATAPDAQGIDHGNARRGRDTQAGALEQRGRSSAAAERGFKGRGYKKVFTDYHTVAEQQINKDQIPDGYRFYVRTATSSSSGHASRRAGGSIATAPPRTPATAAPEAGRYGRED